MAKEKKDSASLIAPTKAPPGKHPNSLKNLRPAWQSGQSGNPGGRKKKLITEAYERLAGQRFPGDAKKRTWAQLAAEGNFKSAIKGKTEAIKEITNRLEGPVVQQTEISGPDGVAVSHTIALDDEILELIKQLAGK
jgi:hypothetical protein